MIAAQREEIYRQWGIKNWTPEEVVLAIEAAHGIKWRSPNHYLYQCTRCNKFISALLKEKQNGN